mmetsp:Transcript_21690/g.88457  ORF Transcript_21690/g.88457 Transcript_21690/m.88457 type:complete len:93 (+) Transcript_21690:898-1176(+)
MYYPQTNFEKVSRNTGTNSKTPQVASMNSFERCFLIIVRSHFSSQWPTIPQLFVKGEFIGGCDIVEGMNSSGDLKKLIDSAVTPSRDAEQKK